ncbi:MULTISPECIES: TROVE domain-containing protein [unclassified Spirosoma]|uniref:TROVE domain-containing protein n=1 Tax=unclassified Spirosoma TaxID=2621999 RepID=UPI0009598E39|nr:MULTISPECIES: TROVE domain-containing protein [unclassified Spirosoma]MBN8823650.1 TROVE domain-containing protein [Spirosoma sp.]OJW76795.1 MAG: ribonucleoprotein [Spirosoma sp. 48-14]
MKFNSHNRDVTKTVNYEGGQAYALTPQLSLYSAVVTTMLNDSHYESEDQRLVRIQELVAQVDPVFVAKLAVYVREQMYLRSAPVVLLGELAKVHHGDGLVGKAVARTVQRPDEITELLSYYQLANGRTGAKKLNRLSKQMQKGLSTAFNKFDEYQFAKYNRDTAVKLRDALFLVHPKAKGETQQAVFDKLVTGTLNTPYTWETELSALGQQSFDGPSDKQLAVRAKWEELIDSGRLGYMATLRNLRNMLEADVSGDHVEKVCALLADAKAVQKAKQLPFRFLAAYRELKVLPFGHVPILLEALEDAIYASTANLRGFAANTRVVVACDVSGSMQKPVSPKSKVLLYDIGLLLGMLLHTKCRNVLSGMFGDTWKTIALPPGQVLANVDEFYGREGEVGYATNGYLVIDDLIRQRYKADKVMLFTDTQLWDNRTAKQNKANSLSAKWIQYKHLFPNARLYVFDLAGYGNAPLRVEQNDVYLIAGWSDKVFDVLQALEEGQTTLSAIEQIAL